LHIGAGLSEGATLLVDGRNFKSAALDLTV